MSESKPEAAPTPPTPPPDWQDTVLKMLDNVQILNPLSPELKQRLASVVTPMQVRAGTTICKEGDPGDAMYIIGSGTVSVYSTSPALGLTLELRRLQQGAAFGEIALINSQPRTASVLAVTDCMLFVLPRNLFYNLVKAVPTVGLEIASALAERLQEANKDRQVLFGTLRDVLPDPGLTQLVPYSFVRRHHMVPIQTQGGTVTIATPAPHNRVGLSEMVRLLRGYSVRVMAVSSEDFDQWVNTHLQGPADVRRSQVRGPRVEYPTSFKPTEDRSSVQTMGTSSGAVVELLSTILAEGIALEATDIFIEPNRTGGAIRYRVDGRLSQRDQGVGPHMLAPLVSRIKVLCNLDITERRLPQDGRFNVTVDNVPYTLRVATVSTLYGEKVVMRVIDRSRLQSDLADMILWDRAVDLARRVLTQPSGMTLVTGPSGSGKTTTLYAALSERNNPEISICTVEDPIEYELSGVTQVPINEETGLTFPVVLRTFLRQSPDIILVGEMRDRPTADLVGNAALTGHFVLSSVHTNDALSVIPRLLDMGVESFVISSSLVGVINQRLVRQICESCAMRETPMDAVLLSLQRAGVTLNRNAPVARGRGCNACNGTGFKGRVGIYEVLELTQELRDEIGRGADGERLRQVARAGAYITLADYASWMLNKGMTTPAEVLRVLPLGEEYRWSAKR